ncbi:MAG TPA: hypothetical protein VIL72_04610, partial [Beijerinckiaceae bacterium]
VNVRRHVPEHEPEEMPNDDAYAIDPTEPTGHAPDEQDVGPVADRARGEPALWDKQVIDPDADPDEEPEDGDGVEVRHKPSR